MEVAFKISRRYVARFGEREWLEGEPLSAYDWR
jgi:hypothetical protein